MTITLTVTVMVVNRLSYPNAIASIHHIQYELVTRGVTVIKKQQRMINSLHIQDTVHLGGLIYELSKHALAKLARFFSALTVINATLLSLLSSPKTQEKTIHKNQSNYMYN